LPSPTRYEILDLASRLDPHQVAELPPLPTRLTEESLNASSVAELLVLLGSE
jgi:hypothetical protein